MKRCSEKDIKKIINGKIDTCIWSIRRFEKEEYNPGVKSAILSYFHLLDMLITYDFEIENYTAFNLLKKYMQKHFDVTTC